MAKKPVASGSGKGGNGKGRVEIQPLDMDYVVIRIAGDSPLMMNNKAACVEEVNARYSSVGGGKAKVPKKEKTIDSVYQGAFYTLPSSPGQPPAPNGLYGIPASGMKKCICSAIRPAGFSDNTTIGLIGKSFRVLPDEGGLILLRHNGFAMDTRAVAVGTTGKMPELRYRPIFPEWECHLRITFNRAVLSIESLGNLLQHAGQYIGWGELRAEKKQGECGGFVVTDAKLPKWASDAYWNVSVDKIGFRVNAKNRTTRRASR